MTADHDPPPAPPADAAGTPARPADVPEAPAPRPASFRQTLSAVLWGLLGIRKRRDLHSDVSSVNPVHLVAMGVGIAALFVIGLVLLVRFITR